MSVDVVPLMYQCIRWNTSRDSGSTLVCAHALLEALPIDWRTDLQFAMGQVWQLAFDGTVIVTGSFEDCVTQLATRLDP